jgi:gibberellin 2-oxidase
MAPGLVEPKFQVPTKLSIEPWSRPKQTEEDLDWAPLATIDLARFDEPGGKQELAQQLYDAVSLLDRRLTTTLTEYTTRVQVTRVGFWVVTNTGLDDSRVLRQFSIGNTFFKEPLSEKRRFPCNFADGEYFGYRENSRWIGDTGVKENIEMVRAEQPAVQQSYVTSLIRSAQHP